MNLVEIKKALDGLVRGMTVPMKDIKRKRAFLDDLEVLGNCSDVADCVIAQFEWLCPCMGASLDKLNFILVRTISPTDWSERGVFFNPAEISDRKPADLFALYDSPGLQTVQRIAKNVYYYGGVDLTVTAGSAFVYGNAHVLAEDVAVVEAHDNASVIAIDNAAVYAHDHSVVELLDYSKGEAFGHAIIIAKDDSQAIGNEHSALLLSGNSSAITGGNCRVLVEGSCKIEAYGKTEIGFPFFETGGRPEIIQRSNGVNLYGFDTPVKMEVYRAELRGDIPLFEL